MQFGLFEIWKRILRGLGLIQDFSDTRHALKSDEECFGQNRVRPPDFDADRQVRVLLFRELNGQDRRLLFDSKSVRKKEPSPKHTPPRSGRHAHARQSNQESSIEKSFKLSDHQSKEFVYEWQRSSPDEQMLREMIFGSVSISYQGSTLKVHTIRSPLQIMLSVVFAAPAMSPTFRIGENEQEESGQWSTQATEISIKSNDKSDIQLAHSVPVNVPSRVSSGHQESQDSDSDSLQSHDGYSSLPTPQHLTPEVAAVGLPRSSSYNSLQRRLLRNKATSIELGLQGQDTTPEEQQYPRVGGTGQKRVKLGLSIVIHLDEDSKQEEKNFTQFLFSHMCLVEGHLMSLKNTVIRAYLNRRNFVQLMFEGAKKFQNAINDLYTAPRLPNPEWLTIISSPNHRHLSYAFLSKFAKLLQQYDKKETHFFVSTLLTAVLTHHLSWVPSVIPTDSKIQSTQIRDHKHTPGWVEKLAKSRPYNPHWVQLSDLYGALGSTLKLSRTVVTGQKRDVVLRFLQVLSYFIRCSDICEDLYEWSDDMDMRLDSFYKSSNETCSSNLSVSKMNSTDGDPGQVILATRSNHHRLTLEEIDSASDSSKDTCDVSITPTEEFDSGLTPSVESGSLGYGSLKQKLEENVPTAHHHEESSSKRVVLREQQPNCSNQMLSSGTSMSSKSGKENHPLVPCTGGGQDSPKNRPEITVTGCEESKNGGHASCYDKPAAYESEEGYHSMEEPHSPGHSGAKKKMQLSEILRQYENWCPEGLDEVLLPELYHSKEPAESVPLKSFGWSLMAGITDHYLADFCLQGLVGGDFCEDAIKEDLVKSTKSNILSEPVSEAVCIVADTDKWCVQLLSSNSLGGDQIGSWGIQVVMSSLVSSICDAVLSMCDLGIPPESCIIYLEDRLQEIYFRSQTLSEYLQSCQQGRHHCSTNTLTDLSKIASCLGVELSDMPLLLSVATTHLPCPSR